MSAHDELPVPMPDDDPWGELAEKWGELKRQVWNDRWSLYLTIAAVWLLFALVGLWMWLT